MAEAEKMIPRGKVEITASNLRAIAEDQRENQSGRKKVGIRAWLEAINHRLLDASLMGRTEQNIDFSFDQPEAETLNLILTHYRRQGFRVTISENGLRAWMEW